MNFPDSRFLETIIDSVIGSAVLGIIVLVGIAVLKHFAFRNDPDYNLGPIPDYVGMLTKSPKNTRMSNNDLHPVHNCFDGIFNAASGTKIDILNPTIDMIKIEDIAHALCNICRFGGHSRTFYSVACHSLLVAGMAPFNIRREALLHDAAEAYVGDIIKPLKVILGDHYESLEWTFMLLIINKFGLDPENLQRVKVWDKIALEIEHSWLFKGDGSEMQTQADKLDYFDPYAPDLTYERFMRAYTEYFSLSSPRIRKKTARKA